MIQRALQFFIFSSLLALQGFCQEKPINVDAIVFSYNRPMQLYAYLESAERHIKHFHQIHVIYRTSNGAFEKAYETVKRRFRKVLFHKQSSTSPGSDFKPLVLASAFAKKSAPYVLFAVDDMFVTRDINLTECIKVMEKWGAFGFFFRMGLNITYCYMRNIPTPPPPGKKVDHSLFLWKFADGQGDWSYPNNLDMTIYRKNDLLYPLFHGSYIHPNSLERSWHQRDNLGKMGICLLASCAINIPVNLVNPSKNRNAHSYSPEELLDKFEKGYKIDTKRFDGIKNSSPHTEEDLSFTLRGD